MHDKHWHLEEGAAPTEPTPGRRPAHYFYREPGHETAEGAPTGISVELKLVNLVRDRVADWRRAGYPGVTATTLELLNYWRRDGRAFRPFFVQLEAVETIIFLNEARREYPQGIDVPRDEPSEKQQTEPHWSQDHDGTRTTVFDDGRICAAGLRWHARRERRRARQRRQPDPRFVSRERYLESDTAPVNRVLDGEARGRKNILVLNDEAHHAYRIRKDEPDPDETDLLGDEDDVDEFYKEATVWIEGLDRVNKAARDQLLRRPVGDALFSRPRRPGRQPAVSVDGE